MQRLAHITMVVKDYEEAIAFYTQKLGFELLEDTQLTETKRWVRIAPPGSKECALLLAKAANPAQQSAVGNQAGGRVMWFLYTDDFDRDYQRLLDHDVTIFRGPSDEAYGKVAVFEDLYGNKWDLIQPISK